MEEDYFFGGLNMKEYIKPAIITNANISGIIPLAAVAAGVGAAAAAAAGFVAANAAQLGAAAGAAYVMAGDDKKMSFDRNLVL